MPVLRVQVPAVTVVALAAIPLHDGGLAGPDALSHARRFFRPADPIRVILSRQAQADLAVLAEGIRPGGCHRPTGERLAPDVRAVRYEHVLPVHPHPRHGRREPPRDRLQRADHATGGVQAWPGSIRWAIDSPHVYWLDRPERSSGLFDLASVDGLEKVRTVGDYTLYRITACGLDP